MDAKPRFTIEKDKWGQAKKIWLHCSNCNAKIMALKETESIRVDRGYYCDKCDDGAHHINFSKGRAKKRNDKTPPDAA